VQTLGLFSITPVKRVKDEPYAINPLRTVVRTADEEKLFERSLRETQIWCDSRANQAEPAKSLRSDRLRPQELLGEGPEFQRRYGNRDLAVTVARLNEIRSGMLQASSESAREILGRVLVFWPEETVHCGASDESSKGFFDLDDAPPWDTWFWYGPIPNDKPGIYAWVPHQLLKLADKGIWANPVECIRWLDTN
jgi:hypothetical protein